MWPFSSGKKVNVGAGTAREPIGSLAMPATGDNNTFWRPTPSRNYLPPSQDVVGSDPASLQQKQIQGIRITDADAFEILMVDMLIGSGLFAPETAFAPQMRGWYTAFLAIAREKYNWKAEITFSDLP